MQFNDTTNLSGAIQECENWLFGNSNYGSISSNTTLLKTFTNLLNYGLDQTFILIIASDGVWRYEDPNNTTLPIATTDLQGGQGKYTLDSTHNAIIGVEVRDNQGNYYPVRQVDYTAIRRGGQSDTEFFKEDGKPMYYDVEGSTLQLFPAPKTSDVTTSDGLRVHFRRTPSYFSYTDTTKVVGTPKMFEPLPILFACAKYAKQNGMADKSRELDAEIKRVTADIKGFISTRNQDRKLQMVPRYNSAM